MHYPLTDDDMLTLSLKVFEDIERVLTDIVLNGESPELTTRLDAALARQKRITDLASVKTYRRKTAELETAYAAQSSFDVTGKKITFS